MQTFWSIARRISAAAAAASAALMIAPPTTTMAAPACTAAAAVSELMPPATETGMETEAATARSVSKGASPRICWSIAVWMPM